MRAFDIWNCYIDDERNPLHGKVRFCLQGTTTDVQIFDKNGTSISNPQFTDALGRTASQVFVTGNVTAIFYKFVGNGQMTDTANEDYDPARWEQLYTIDSVEDYPSVDYDAETYDSANTMAMLRGLDPSTVHSVNGQIGVWLLGYLTQGDKEPVFYRFDADSTATDDGGSVICPTGRTSAGRWIMNKVTGVIDVRHFGLFPAYSATAAAESTAKWAAIANYANLNGLDVYISDFDVGDPTRAFYKFAGETFIVSGNIIAAPRVRLCCKTDTNGTIITCSNFVHDDDELWLSDDETGTGVMTANVIRTSWAPYSAFVSLYAREKWIVPNDIANFDFTNGSALEIEAEGTIGVCCEFENQRITESMLQSSGYPVVASLSLTNCTVDIADFSSAYAWAVLSLKNGATVLDFHGRNVEGGLDANGASLKLVNLSAEPSTAGDVGLAVINCGASLVLQGVVGAGNSVISSDAVTVNVIDSICQHVTTLSSFNLYAVDSNVFASRLSEGQPAPTTFNILSLSRSVLTLNYTFSAVSFTADASRVVNGSFSTFVGTINDGIFSAQNSNLSGASFSLSGTTAVSLAKCVLGTITLSQNTSTLEASDCTFATLTAMQSTGSISLSKCDITSFVHTGGALSNLALDRCTIGGQPYDNCYGWSETTLSGNNLSVLLKDPSQWPSTWTLLVDAVCFYEQGDTYGTGDTHRFFIDEDSTQAQFTKTSTPGVFEKQVNFVATMSPTGATANPSWTAIRYRFVEG